MENWLILFNIFLGIIVSIFVSLGMLMKILHAYNMLMGYLQKTRMYNSIIFTKKSHKW